MSVSDMEPFGKQVTGLVDHFESSMLDLLKETPEAFKGRSTEDEWKTQVSTCCNEMQESIQKVIEAYEMKLHDGRYF